MPEYPDVVIYQERLAAKLVGQTLRAIRLATPFVLRSVEPGVADVVGRQVVGVERIAKRLVIVLRGDLFVVLHLMIAGRLRWKTRAPSLRTSRLLALFDLPNGCLVFTEASKKKRASLHLVAGRDALAAFDPGGRDPLSCTTEQFADALKANRHTLKRALTDPRILAGIGNAYSDEILFEARLSPVALTTSLSAIEIDALHQATRLVLLSWAARHRDSVGEGFPDKVTAFHPDMAVHGRFREPCRRCHHPVQRVVRGDHETNYCAYCQTGGKLLADRALSQLLKSDWPRTLEEMELRRTRSSNA